MLFVMEAIERECTFSERAKTRSIALTAAILLSSLELASLAALADNAMRATRTAVILTDIIALLSSLLLYQWLYLR